MARPQFSSFRDFDVFVDDYDSDNESDAMSQSSSGPFSPMEDSSSHTSHSRSRSVSPTPSVTSITSSLRERSYHIEYGRSFNSYSEVYRLPADDEELERLDNQHIMFMAVMGKYVPPLRDVLKDDGEPKAALDLGCGSGAWVMDLARDFPHVECVAVDLVPMQSASMPPNCRSEVDDINLGLEHFYGEFNFVHTRMISSGIKDYPALINHIAQCLKPGGLIDLMEFEFTVHDGNRNVIQIDTSTMGAPWWPRWLEFVRQAAMQRGADLRAANNMHRWITEHGDFEDVVYREFWIPCCPWQKGEDPCAQWWRSIGEVERDDILRFLRAGRPLLLGSGLDENLIDLMETNAKEELMNCAIDCSVRVQNVYARKRRTLP